MTNIEIADRLDAIAAELDAHPERWTTRYLARSASGKETDPRGPDAVRWCTSGFLMRDGLLEETPPAAMEEVMKEVGYKYFPQWNDAPGHTPAEVAA